MNLYRNFGTLLETWLTDTISEDNSTEEPPQAPETLTPSKSAMGTDSQRTGMLLKSESEDSGLEEAPISPQGSEQSFSLARDSDLVDSEGPLSRAAPLPSSQVSCNQSQNIVERALQRTRQTSIGSRRKAFSLSFTNSWTLSFNFNERSGEQELPAVLTPQPLKNQHCQQEPKPNNERSEDQTQRQAWQLQLEAATISIPQDEVKLSASPSHGWPSFGPTYLEQVCRLLEEIARLRARNQELEREKERLQEQQRSKDVTSSQYLHSGSKTGGQEPALKSRGYEFKHFSLKSKPSSDKVLRRSISDSNLSDCGIGNLMKQQQSESVGNLSMFSEVDKMSQTTAQKEKETHKTSSLKRTIWKKKDKQNKELDSQQTSPCEEQKSSQHLGLLFKKMSLKKP
ncbi:uncharacterized protein LOC108932862 isoform X1 [Scleropages formosus]|uniref:uncharacterized protein LOC108932862 isoform X1 n=1 Tax=Scleropages formosus TaxID=113540 RepID=UPI0010FAC0D9|nr:uncharacterized protein LOC108932862 isoform X1 [Scleropages formosus]